MKKLLISATSKILVGLLLAIAGLALTIASPASTPTGTRAAGNDYQSSWKATELYRLHFSYNNGNGFTNLGAIGVKKWTVTGEVAGSTFIETWTGPAASTINFSESSQGGGSANCKVTADPKLWLGSCLFLDNPGSSPSGKYGLSEVAVDSLVREGRGLANSNSYAGSGAFCTSSGIAPRSCWSTTGTYGFTRFTQNSNSSSNGNPEYVGVMMPLQWEVRGSIQ